jgi:hypothetical protein
MFMAVYLALCGIQYLIVLSVLLILIRRKTTSNSLRQWLPRYAILALTISFLGLILFSLATIPVGNLDFNFPKDFTQPKLILANLPKILTILLGLVGITAPVWTLVIAMPKQTSG